MEWPLSSQLERRLWSIGKPSPRTEKCNSAAPVEAPSIPIQPKFSRPSRDRRSTKDHQEKGGGPGHFVGKPSLADPVRIAALQGVGRWRSLFRLDLWISERVRVIVNLQRSGARKGGVLRSGCTRHHLWGRANKQGGHTHICSSTVAATPGAVAEARKRTEPAPGGERDSRNTPYT